MHISSADLDTSRDTGPSHETGIYRSTVRSLLALLVNEVTNDQKPTKR